MEKPKKDPEGEIAVNIILELAENNYFQIC